MDYNEKIKIISLARLCGALGGEKEILEKFDAICKETESRLQKESKPAEVEVFKRPF